MTMQQVVCADRAQCCVEQFGAAHAVLVGDDVPARFAALTDGDYHDAVFDATGSPQAMPAGFGNIAHAGRHVLVSIVAADIAFNDPEFHKRETTLLGSRNATREDFVAVIAAIRDGRVPTAAMHAHSAPLVEVPTALPGWMQPPAHVIKAIVEV